MFINFKNFFNTPFNISEYRLEITDEDRPMFEKIFSAIGFSSDPEVITIDAHHKSLSLQFLDAMPHLSIAHEDIQSHWSDYAQGDNAIKTAAILELLQECIRTFKQLRTSLFTDTV